ncbi:Branched-chain-amino-acid aminotransferase [Austwickia sp. TVS 96-490-7B]|uniref:branched-chain amino acid aminotransferase n=1 Tax=Austwickia sp. TVS 96-490-7B TaxID=2830843 RepID=UPI001C5A52C9|nr:branched-chain amino acid aminotransferase [Austwickia sp. TVS 96-490-7B]MBW3085771.1 Branched-chain-amino-acid aminotransferase [Austwickia sp. TVS 96-490-7B]
MTLTFPLRAGAVATGESDRAAILANPGFGKHFTDHMAVARWTVAEGWHDARIEPYGPLQIDPAAAVLHYAQEVFEGLKAYRHEDGSVWTFRPEANGERLQHSAQRLALPPLPVEDFLTSLRALVAADQAWVPAYGTGETSLYLRPFMYASEAFLGVRPSHEVTYAVIASPAGAYFSRGVTPVNLWVSTQYARAGAGGTGAAKCGGNYASSLAGQLEGIQNHCDQAVFLDSATHEYIEELGGMNLFLVYRDGRIVTPELTGSILPGVTRRSILELAAEMGLTPQERRIAIQEWKDGAASGEITEIFACGTAAVITPVGELRWEGGSCDHRPAGAGDEMGEVTARLRSMLLDIQYGRVEDTRGWMTRLV